MTFVLLISSFALAVLILNEKEALGKATEERDRAIKNYQAAEKWFIAAVSMANNEQDIVSTLMKIQKDETRRWDEDWNGDTVHEMSTKDKRFIDNSILGHLLKMHSAKQAED